MEKLNYFNYCASAILIALLISVVVRKIIHGKVNHYFLAVVGLAVFSVVCDIFCVELDNGGPGYLALKYVMHTGYLVSHNFSTPLYLLYLIALADVWHIMRRHRLLFGLLMSPLVIVGVLSVVNFFAPVLFYFDANDHYTRGPGFWVLYVSAVIYAGCGLLFLFRCRKLFEKKLFVPVLALFPMQIAAVVVQMIRPEVPIEMFAQALGMLLIATIIQRPEERLDIVTGLGKYNAYVQDMKRSFVSGKSTDLILVNLKNYRALYELLGYDGTNGMLNGIAEKLTELDRRMGTHAELYYLDEGRFCIVTDPRFRSRAEETAKAINQALRIGMQISQMDINVTACVCVAACPEDIADFETLNTFGHDFSAEPYTGEVLYARDILKRGRYDLMCQMDTIIERAFVNHNFSVYYQPIYSVNERRFNSAEALLRLKDEQYGFISPELFIPAAEKSGAIHRIGDYVMEEVCRFIASAEFQALGLDYVEVNLSVAQCMQRDLTEKILGTLERYHVTPDQINLEITETAASNSQRIMEENIIGLTQAGLKFSLDDFGTGYSNMRRVASLPLTLVKLDKTFTGTQGNPNMEIVLQNTIRMLKDMKMKIVVEGVETQNMVEQFAQLKCEYIQGYYYSKPIPREEFVAFITRENNA